MNNLRKVLALVLVVATLMGFASMASAKFADSEKIVNEEAVDLLTALNVVVGRENGEFDPTGIVTRAEMAKMIAVLVNGGEFNFAEYADACDFSDMKEKEEWKRGAVAYCAEVDIIDGYEDGTFRPEQPVKIVEAAKMILAALGYEATKAGFTGAKWATQVAAVANDHDILAGVTKLTKEYADRDTAALMMYNGLQATMVKWDNDALIIDGDKVISVGDYENRTHVTIVDGIEKSETIELYEDAFEGDLRRDPAVSGYANIGEFDAPAIAWHFQKDAPADWAPKGIEGAICVTYAKVRASYTEAVTLKKIYTDVCKGTDPKTIFVSQNGTNVAGNYEGATSDFVKGLKRKAAAADSALTIGAQGTLTEVYLENGNLSIIIKDTFVGSSVVDSVNNLNITPKFDINAEWKKNVKNTNYTLDNDVLNIVNGAVILFRLDNNYPMDVVAADRKTAVNNQFISASDDNHNGALEDGEVAEVTLGTTAYKFNIKAIDENGNFINEGNLKSTVGMTCNAWMDYFGNVMYIKGVPDNSKLPYNFAYVLAARTLVDSWETEGTQAGAGALEVYEAKLLMLDENKAAVVKTVEVTAAAEVKVGDVFAYDVKDEVYTLYKPQIVDDPATAVKDGRDATKQADNYWALYLTGDLQVAGNTAIVLKDAATGKAIAFDADHAIADETHELIVNDDTIFVIESNSGLTTSTFKAYEGVKNIPAVTTGKIAVAFAHNTVKNDDGTTRLVYDEAKVVFVMDSKPVETPEGTGIIVKADGDKQMTTNVGGTAVVTFEVNAILDGKVVKLIVDEATYTALEKGATYFQGLKYTEGVVSFVDIIDYDEENGVELKDYEDMYKDYIVDVKWTAGVLLGQIADKTGAMQNYSKYTAANVPAYIYDGSKLVVGTIANLKDTFDGYAILDTAGEFVLFIGKQ